MDGGSVTIPLGRKVRRPTLVVLNVTIVFGCIAGCTSSHSSPPQPRTALAPATPSSRPLEVTRQRLPLCRIQDVAVSVEQYAAGGLGVKAADHGPTCRLTGAAVVTGYDGTGRRIAVMTSRPARHHLFTLQHSATAIAWMTINDQNTSCKVVVRRMSVRLRSGTPAVTVTGGWFAYPSATDPPYSCGHGRGPATPKHPYSISTTAWRKAPAEPSPGPANG